MKKLSMLILLAVFATASVTACGKDKKNDDKSGDKAEDDKDKKGDTAAKGADTDKKKTDEAAGSTATRETSRDEAGDTEDPKDSPEVTTEEDTQDKTKDGDKGGDTGFDEAFAKEAMAAFEGFVKIMEDNKDDCPKMASELESYMKKNKHIKDKIDAIESDPKQKQKWEEITGEQDKAIEARMMPALEGCLDDPAMEAVFNNLQ